MSKLIEFKNATLRPGGRARRSIVASAASLLMLVSFSAAAFATTLQGSVEDEDTITRLNRSNQESGGVEQSMNAPAVAPDFRARRGLVDTTAFNSPPLRGRADRDSLGLIKPDNFDNSKFDLGADRGSRELVLAWGAWHKQLSGAIYSRWSQVASVPGEATLRVTVTRDRQLSVQVIRSSGNPFFDRGLIDTIMSLNGNPGLTFPSGSQRQQVSFEADYIASTNIKPGYSWVKNDYETIQQSY